MSTKIPEVGTRVMGLLLMGGRGTCLSFGTVTGHTRATNSRSVVGITVEHDGGEMSDYGMSSHGDYWELVTDHKVTALDVQPVNGTGWKSRYGDYPARATSAEAVEDAREWWTAKAQVRKP